MVIEEREFVVDIDAFHPSNVGNIEGLNNSTSVNTEVLRGGEEMTKGKRRSCL
jgi:hypothetical protein